MPRLLRTGWGRAAWRRLACAIAIGLAVAAVGPASQAWSAPAARAPGADSYTFAFHDADVSQVVQEVLGAVGVPYAIDPAVTGRLSFRIEQRLTREQLLAAFEVVLQSNGFALVHNGDQLIVVPESKAKSAAGIHRRAPGGSSAGYDVVAIPLAFAVPSEVAKALEAISPANNVIYTSDRLGLIVMGGSGQQLQAAMESLKILDQNAFQDTKIRYFELNQAQSATVAAELDRIVQGSGLAGISIVPLRRLNGIIVFGHSAEALAEIARWVVTLDTTGKEAGSSLWVYRPHATSAESLARTLNSTMGLQNTLDVGGANGADIAAPRGGPAATLPSAATVSPGVPSGLGGDDQVRIGIDKDSNALIIFASPGRWAQIQKILAEIDRTPRQVLIEASILEVTLTKDFEFGVDWSILSNDVTISSINNRTGSIGPSFPGFSLTFLNNDISAAVHALGAKTRLEVISAPKIIALDGRTAHLQVGDQVPVVTQSSQSTTASDAPVINAVDYRSTGVILTVTPRVTGDDQLILEVSQEVSSVAKTASSGIDSPTIQQRRFESALVMHDGGVVALGGLIGATRNSADSGVPGLKDIPVVGALFKSQSHNSDRTELIVLLTAKVIKDVASSDAAMLDLLKDMHEVQTNGLLPVRH